MADQLVFNGDQAIAYSWKQINPDVVASYPITPQTIIVENFSEFVANGEVDTEYVCAESEHSAMSLCIGASAAGARVATATASAGLAFMWEVLWIASAMRLPIVMSVANRALSGPINIHCDHSDAMGARDTGWVQMFGENVQEAYDDSLMSFRIAEDMKVRLPVMNCIDGFITTHALEKFIPMETADVKKYIGEYKPVRPLLDLIHPTTYGPFTMNDYYFEHKYQIHEAMQAALPVVRSTLNDFGQRTGRHYDVAEGYRTEDADYVIMAMGSTAGTLRYVVDQLRAEGHKVGSVKLRLFRPFPYEDVAKLLQGKKGVAVMDRAISMGSTGPMFPEVRSALYDAKDRPKLVNYVYGLGGRDVRTDELVGVFKQLMDGSAKTMNFMGVRV
ncbi:MAG: Pyruvate synthase subunit PorA [Methanomassiliicoccales archaeon PtaU1.Bin124]|nr:MAG: Pyruvate synthase subunit PorA [Methanomassiliicoccales archaeon PtaU1.Bin124]